MTNFDGTDMGKVVGEEFGVGVKHHFAGGVYCKETLIPAGVKLAQHRHSFDHLSHLASGRVRLSVDGVDTEHTAPATLTIVAGKVHEVTALTAVIWLCIHATDCTDSTQVDRELVAT